MAQEQPFELLRSYERRGRDHEAELPAAQEIQEQWGGIGFRLGGNRFVAPLNEVVELLTYPEISQVPRTKPWVKGMANVRGNLLPVMDLNGYLGRRLANLTRLSRVLVIDQEGVFTGLLVDEVLGMRHFLEDEECNVPADVDAAIKPYVSGAFARGGDVWLEFSMKALAATPQFLKVAS